MRTLLILAGLVVVVAAVLLMRRNAGSTASDQPQGLAGILNTTFPIVLN